MRVNKVHKMIFWILAVTLVAVLPAVAQEPPIQTDHFWVTTDDHFSIHVMHKFMEERRKVPVLLVPGSWENSRAWDFPGRSVMDYLAVRGYDVYALDLRGMGQSDRPGDYSTIDLFDRVKDVAAVAGQILESTNRRPVIAGWSEGGLLTGIVAACKPDLVAGVGLFSIPADGFYIPPEWLPLIEEIVASGVDRYLPPHQFLYAGEFGVDPVTGNPTMSPEAFQIFYGMSEPESVHVVLEEFSSAYFQSAISPAWPMIHVPALVVDGALDINVGAERAQDLFDALGSDRKQLIILPRNTHCWFLEDNREATMRVFDRFLSKFE